MTNFKWQHSYVPKVNSDWWQRYSFLYHHNFTTSPLQHITNIINILRKNKTRKLFLKSYMAVFTMNHKLSFYSFKGSNSLPERKCTFTEALYLLFHLKIEHFLWDNDLLPSFRNSQTVKRMTINATLATSFNNKVLSSHLQVIKCQNSTVRQSLDTRLLWALLTEIPK